IDPADPQVNRDLELFCQAVCSFGKGIRRHESGKWELDGFTTHLYPHQVIGVSWMVGREMHPVGPKGGILADEMGLGKTVQVLACMSQNLPSRKSRAQKTLIVVPKRVLQQWLKEIGRHCSNKNAKMKPAFVYSAGRADEEWEDRNIILVNYEQLLQQLPSPEDRSIIDELRSQNNPDWKVRMRESAGRLFQEDWYRLVLDEAHRINNRFSQKFFPYLDFLRTVYNEFGSYRNDMGNTEDASQLEKLKTTYQAITLRRFVDPTHTSFTARSYDRRLGDKLMGREIIDVPTPHMETIMVDFCPAERKFYQELRDKYNALLERSQISRSAGMSSDVSKGELIRVFNSLRFYTSHPALVDPGYVSEYPSDCVTVQCFCRLCRNVLVEPVIAQCSHAFCRACLRRSQREQNQRPCLSCGTVPDAARDAEDNECFRHHPTQYAQLVRDYWGPDQGGKGTRYKRTRKPGEDEFGLQPLLDRQRTTRKRRGRARGRGRGRKGQGSRRKTRPKKKDVAEEQIRIHAGAFLRACDQEPWEPIPHGAKTKATLDLVQRWQEEAPDDKIIIFAQWLPVLNLLGRMLFHKGLRFVYLWGQMKPGQQEGCIRAFTERPEIKIMLVSATCGALGLNLTAANRAIVYDHWWNEVLERQAFARIVRIGQAKPVYLAKVVAADSMDEDILNLQATKRSIINNAVGESTTPSESAHMLGGGFDLGISDGELDFEANWLAGMQDLSDDDNTSTDDSEAESETESGTGDEGSDDDEDDNESEDSSDEESTAHNVG
ncbi:uncharacterized protein THITE_2024961, partial [Thermothielavioides terrestris NRRL 8126]